MSLSAVSRLRAPTHERLYLGNFAALAAESWKSPIRISDHRTRSILNCFSVGAGWPTGEYMYISHSAETPRACILSQGTAFLSVCLISADDRKQYVISLSVWLQGSVSNCLSLGYKPLIPACGRKKARTSLSWRQGAHRAKRPKHTVYTAPHRHCTVVGTISGSLVPATR